MAGVFANPLSELRDYEELTDCLKKGRGPLMVNGTVDSEKVHFMSTFLEEDGYQLVVTYSEQRAREICEDYKLFTPDAGYFPAKDMIFFQADLQSNVITAQRMQILKQMLEKKSGVVVTTMSALMNVLPPCESLRSGILTFEEGQEYSMDELRKRLVETGYERVGRVEETGQFCIHGGILDIFPLTEESPVRIEFWGDEIDSIRYFEVLSQRSIEQISSVKIFPATELVIDNARKEEGALRIRLDLKKQTAALKKLGAEEKKPKKKSGEAKNEGNYALLPGMELSWGEKIKRLTEQTEEFLEMLSEEIALGAAESYVRYFYPQSQSFLDYFAGKKLTIFLDEPIRLAEQGEAVQLEFEESMKSRLEQGSLLPGQSNMLYPAREILAHLQSIGDSAGSGSARGASSVLIAMSALDAKCSHLHFSDSFSIHVQNMNTYKNSFEMLIRDLQQWKKEKYRIILLSASHTRAERLAHDLREYELNAFYSEEENKSILPGEIMVACGNLHRGFMYPQLKFVVITESDIFGLKKKKRTKKSEYQGQRIRDFADLKPGDYVVHENNGLGIYRGIQKEKVEGVVRDFIKIEYGDGGKLYIPVTQLDAIQKYADAAAKPPKLNKLGGTEWHKTKSRVQKAVKDIARDLVELYAKRQQAKGFAFEKDTIWQKEFEELFSYEETDDQMAAIEDTKRDMESTKIMDRLVCGDVGYGKTEIAIRAAFKAVQEGKQVVYLVPTTILAQQHYNNFCQRMKDFPVTVELLSRFRTPQQSKLVLENLKKGLVDIVIGTHRVLSKDVKFKDLGLLIIDEEQRFGVTHKEKIKQMKENVDVLTLTATPIPRTLHMSLIGVRDMSVLEEAPSERKPIQTYVMELNWEMVREAINRELARDGQVYYVYNRVKDIDLIASEIARLVPDANVAFAHGQMSERQMEKIMMEFVNGEIDVLVSTTIIETGLDIPNVNTIIIHDSDRYGLSQLYQLRGRVGRSSRTAYAFILYQKGKILRDVAEKRLQAIREYTDLGSGIKIAMRDLEIRGAGNLLGSEQHGHMESVGYDLYCKMLNEAVRMLKGEIKEEETFQTTLDISISAYIPDSYIRNELLKMDIYKRIAAIENDDEGMDMTDELIDRFGDVPQSVINLISISVLRSYAHSLYIREVKALVSEIRIYFHPNDVMLFDQIPKLVDLYKGSLRIVDGTDAYFHYTMGKGKIRDKKVSLENLKVILDDVSATLFPKNPK